jgi:hypothetical protein
MHKTLFAMPLWHGLTALVAALLVLPAQADYLWLERAADGMRVRAGELTRPEPVPALQGVRVGQADASAVAVTLEGAAPGLPAAGQGDLRLSAYRLGEQQGQRTLIYYQARYGRAETRAVNDLELVPTTPGGNTFRLMWKGQAVAPTRVNVDTSAGWHRTLTAADDGTVTLTTPFPGAYVLEVTARIDGSITVDGKRFDDVRHTATLSFDVPDTPASAP